MSFFSSISGPGDAGSVNARRASSVSCDHGISPFRLYPQESKSLFYLTGVDSGFKRMVVPGDQLIYVLKLVRSRGKAFLKVYGEARVDGELACSADLTAMHVNEE